MDGHAISYRPGTEFQEVLRALSQFELQTLLTKTVGQLRHLEINDARHVLVR